MPICQKAVLVTDNLPVGDEGIVNIGRRINDPENQAAAAGRGRSISKELAYAFGLLKTSCSSSTYSRAVMPT